MQYLPTGNPGDGDFPANIERTYTFTEAATAYGQVFQLDVANVAAGSAKPGGTTALQSLFATLRQPDSDGLAEGYVKYAPFRMAIDVTAAGSKGKASRCGVYENVPVPANVVTGDALVATAGSNAFTRGNVSYGGSTFQGNLRGKHAKIIAIALTDRSSGGTSTIWFDGDGGFGYDGQDALT